MKVQRQAAFNQALATRLAAFQAQVNRPPLVLLMGDAGVGKTVLTRAVKPGIKILDDFTLTDDGFNQAVATVWKYDDPTFKGAVLTCNEDTLTAQFRKHHPGDTQITEAFLRRCVVFRFTYKKSGIFSRYGPADVSQEKYDEVVKIEKYVNQMYVRDVAYRGVLTELATLEPRTDEVDYSFHYHFAIQDMS